MKTFKTNKGTELPLLDLRGKDYLQVAHRLVWFREEHPDWSIITEFVSQDAQSALAKATIYKPDGQVVATSHKFEDKQGFGDYREKAETGAIGRAVALCGYGTQFAPDLDEGERIVDSPQERVSVKPAGITSPATQAIIDQSGEYRIPFGRKYGPLEGKPGMSLREVAEQDGPDAIRSYVGFLEKSADKDGKPLSTMAQEFIRQAQMFLGNLENDVQF